MKTKLTVIVDSTGNIIATHSPEPTSTTGFPAQSGLYPLSGQTLHEVEFEVPSSFRSHQDIEDFHIQLRDHLAHQR
jgi:hypothetical protein